MFRSPHPSSRSCLRIASQALAATSLVAVASACGGGSSGGGHAINPAVTLQAGLKLQKAGNLTGAAALYRQVIAVQPNNVYAHFDLGVVDQTDSNTVAALADYGAALVINPKYVPALYNEATIYTSSDPVLAISLYRQIVAIEPTSSASYLNLGFLEVQKGEPKQGVRDMATAVQQDGSLLARIPKHLQTLVSAVASPSPQTTPSSHNSPKSSSTPTTTPS